MPTNHEPTNKLLADVRTFATEWVASVEHFSKMVDKSFDPDEEYEADDLAQDISKLSANAWRDLARFYDASAQAWAIAARRGMD